MNDNSILLNGDCLEMLKEIPSDSLDSLVTDPPAGIAFMGKAWDEDKGGRKQWVAWMESVMVEALRVLKPGAHGLVWALPRTSHWTATALEDAGFEIRDVVTHLFGTGFPKSMDISKAIDKAAGAERKVIGPGNRHASKAFGAGEGDPAYGTFAGGVPPETAPATDAAKQWEGWGTALKPASEHWILVRKPCSEKTVAANVLKWGTGGINIDASRIASAEKLARPFNEANNEILGKYARFENPVEPTGRFPANLVLDEEAAASLDAQSGTLKSGGGDKGQKSQDGGYGKGFTGRTDIRTPDSGGASRFFYVAKASKTDKGGANTHPTVKSTALMSYLIKLVTPPGGMVLDPFMGSGTTGVAALKEGFSFLGIEKEAEYFAISEARIGNAGDDKESA